MLANSRSKLNNLEEWRDVVGYEGDYEVSSHGRVRTHEGKTTYTKRHGVRKWKQRVLKEKNKNAIYARVDLWSEGKPKTILVHRLVAKAFLDNTEEYEYVNHKDGNPRNNNVDNLEWCSFKENVNHAFDNDMNSSARRVVVVHRETGEKTEFRSMSKASLFIGKGSRHIDYKIRKTPPDHYSGKYMFFLKEDEDKFLS